MNDPIRSIRSIRSVAIVALALTAMRPSIAIAAPSVYETDVKFALEEIEKRCGHFFGLKKINWRAVSKEFLAESRKVKNHAEHMLLLQRLLARLKDGHAAVKRLKRGSTVSPPREPDRVGIGMSWCISDKKVLVKQVWGAAEKAGLRPGVQISRVNGLPARKWLDRRVAELSDRISFSTDHQALAFACHWGLSDERGTKLQLEVRSTKGRRGRLILTYGSADRIEDAGPAFFPDGLKQTKDIKFGTLAGDIGYVYVRRCPGDLPEVMDRALEHLGNVRGMILDFRGNSGGGFDHDALLGRFVPEGKSIAFGKRIASAGPSPYGGPVVVIVDANVRSAGETGSGMFKEDGRAYMIGESPTAGMSSSKQTIELPSGLFGLYVSVFSNKKRFQGGRGIEGIGIIPHETVEYDAKDLAGGKDTLTERAVAIFKKYPQAKVRYRPAAFGWEAP